MQGHTAPPGAFWILVAGYAGFGTGGIPKNGPSVAETPRRPPQPATARFGLSTRAAEVVGWIEQGASDAEIADALVVSRHTVHKHLQNIYRKLGVKSRTAALAALRG